MVEVGELAYDNALSLVRPFLDELYHHSVYFKLFLEELQSSDDIWQEPFITSLLTPRFSALKACVIPEPGKTGQPEMIKKAIMRTVVNNSNCTTKNEVTNPECPTQPQLTACVDHYQPDNGAYRRMR